MARGVLARKPGGEKCDAAIPDDCEPPDTAEAAN